MVLTQETIQETRKWFADNAEDCINGAMAGEFFVNDISAYVDWQRRRITQSLSGEWDHTFTFLQRALYIQTGVCVPLLS